MSDDLRSEVEAAVLEEVKRVGPAAVDTAAIVNRFLGGDAAERGDGVWPHAEIEGAECAADQHAGADLAEQLGVQQQVRAPPCRRG